MIKHKILKDFTFATAEKKVLILKANSTLENYIYAASKSDKILVDKDLVDNNPDFFKPLDWREELTIYAKTQKIPQPAQIVKKLIPFIDETLAAYSPLKNEPIDARHKIHEYDLQIKEVEVKFKEYQQLISEITQQRRDLEQEKLNLEIELKRKSSSALMEVDSLKIDLERKYENLAQTLRQEYREKNQGLLNLSVDQDKKIRDLESDLDLRLKSLDGRELDLDQRERKISYKEEEMELRKQKLEQREENHKIDLHNLDLQSEGLQEQKNSLALKEAELQTKADELSEKERNIDLQSLNSTQAIDQKYSEVQARIMKDSAVLSEREKSLDKKAMDYQKLVAKLEKEQAKLQDEIRDWDLQKEEFLRWQDDLQRLDNEIKSWEGLHWKMRRAHPPASAIIDK